MTEVTDIRRENRISISGRHQFFSPTEFHELAINLNTIFEMKDYFMDYLSKLKVHCCISKVSNDVNDEIMIFNFLCVNFTYDLPFDVFEQFEQSIATFLQQRGSYVKFKKILLPFFFNLGKMVHSTPFSAYSAIVIKLTAVITSKSAKYTEIAQKIYSLEFLFEIINSEDICGQGYYASLILSNILYLDVFFYPFGQFFSYIDALMLNGKLESLPHLLYCISKMLTHYDQIEYQQMFISNNRIEYFNSLLRSNDDEILKNVLLIFNAMITQRLSLDNIDLLEIFKMFTRNDSLATYSVKIVANYVQKCPESADVLCSLQLIPLVTNVLHQGSCEAKIQALNIIYSLLCSASPGNKAVLIQAPILRPLLELAQGINEFVVGLIFNVFHIMIGVAATFNLSENLKNCFLLQENYDILEDLAGREDQSAQLAGILLDVLNNVSV